MRDQLGAACSGLCVIHCLAMPALLAAGSLGALGGLLASKSFHLALLVPVAGLAVISFPPAYREHRRAAPAGAALAGLSLLLGAHLGPHAWEAALTTAGGLLLITAHLINHRFQQAQRYAGD